MPVAPQGAQDEAERGLAWRREFGRGGTEVGIARARDISNGVDLSMDTVRRMNSYFARHEVDKQGEGFRPGEPGYPSNGRVAWALWGGDPAQTWAARLVAQDARTDMNDETRSIDDGIYPFAPVQRDLYDKLESITEVFGQFDQTSGAQGSHYMADNPFAVDGIACSNCAFYDGPRACEIVAGDIDPNAVCKFWIIPESLLTGEAQGPATDPMGDPVSESAPARYAVLEAEQRRIGGRDVEFRTVEIGPLELRVNEGDGMSFRGYAAVFDSPSEPLPFIESIAPGAFRRSLNSGREVRAFVNHDMGQVLATTKNGSLRLSEDSRGLLVEADLPNTTAGRDLAELVRTGTVHSMSFGFSVPRGGDAWSEDRTSRELREVILHEVSVVTGFPAYPATEGATVRTTESVVADESADRALPVALARRILALNAKR